MHAFRFNRQWLLLLAGFFLAGMVALSSSPVHAAGEDAENAEAGEQAGDPAGDPHDHAEGDHAEGDHGAGGGVPMEPESDLVLWSIVTFVLFLIVLKMVAWGPLVEGLDKRESKYRKLVEDARADRDKAMALLGDYEQKLKAAQDEVSEIIAEARRDAERTKTDILESAQKEAEMTRQRALDEIDRARDQAVNELFEHVRSNVVAATETILARSLTDEDHQRLVDEALSELSSARG